MYPKATLNFLNVKNRFPSAYVVPGYFVIIYFIFVHMALDMLRRVCRQQPRLSVTVQIGEDRDVPSQSARYKEPHPQ